MRTAIIALSILCCGTAAIAQADDKAFDPRSLRGTQQGPLTQVLNLGSAHLAQQERKPKADELAPLLGKLAAFKPDIITHEGLSGEQCDQLERYKATYGSAFDSYCWGTADVEKSTGLTVPAALERIEATLKAWPQSPSHAERRRLASLFLAANDRSSALVQWLRLPPAERKEGDGIDQALMALLEKGAKSPNETVVIAVALAVRLGHDRVYAVDDHSADSIQVRAGAGFEPALMAMWKDGEGPLRQLIEADGKMTADVARSGDYLGYYRLINQPRMANLSITADFGQALKLKGPELYGRQYVGWYETRNLRMVANIRAAFANRPGARVLNLVGSSHKGYFDAYLDMMSDVQIVDVQQVLK